MSSVEGRRKDGRRRRSEGRIGGRGRRGDYPGRRFITPWRERREKGKKEGVDAAKVMNTMFRGILNIE